MVILLNDAEGLFLTLWLFIVPLILYLVVLGYPLFYVLFILEFRRARLLTYTVLALVIIVELLISQYLLELVHPVLKSCITAVVFILLFHRKIINPITHQIRYFEQLIKVLTDSQQVEEDKEAIKLYDHHLRYTRQLIDDVRTNTGDSDKLIKEYFAYETRAYGWSYLPGDNGTVAEKAFWDLRKMFRYHRDY
ncbi:MAG: hypothetical protein V4721_00220 [Bacteroidota bacterium]